MKKMIRKWLGIEDTKTVIQKLNEDEINQRIEELLIKSFDKWFDGHQNYTGSWVIKEVIQSKIDKEAKQLINNASFIEEIVNKVISVQINKGGMK